MPIPAAAPLLRPVDEGDVLAEGLVVWIAEPEEAVVPPVAVLLAFPVVEEVAEDVLCDVLDVAVLAIVLVSRSARGRETS